MNPLVCPLVIRKCQRVPLALLHSLRSRATCVFQKVRRCCALMVLSANTAMTIAVGHLRAMFRTGVLNTLTGKVIWSVSPQICFLKHIAWVVRAVTFLAMVQKGVLMMSAAVGPPMWSLLMHLVRCPIIYFSLFPMVECSFLESLLSMSQLHLDLGDQQRAVDAQWQLHSKRMGCIDHREMASSKSSEP